ncbi:MAG: GDYXXLXY domain-containing protein [Desulfuromonadales bacterium]|nr:GDYXXLXY domain-containing protein [Desulfuromonadales bacterium]
MRRIILLVTTLLLLGAINFTIYQREQLLSSGRVVLLELAPVDPRSLMQGDYMALRFKLANQAFAGQDLLELGDGHLVVAPDARGVATFVRFADGTPLAGDELLLRYRIRNGQSKFATNAYFFQEGHAGDYESARFGEFRVAPDGESILTHLRDEQLNVLELKGR